MSKSEKGSAGVAVSVDSEKPPANGEATPQSLSEVAPASPATATQQQSVVNLGLSSELYDKLSLDMRRALHAVEMGWDVLSKPTDILKRNQVFYVIDALVIEDYLDKRNGELTSKCVFVLEFEDSHVETVMQSAARPRLNLAKGVENARLLGATYRAGPYKFAAVNVNNQLNDAIIFERQPGWRQLIG